MSGQIVLVVDDDPHMRSLLADHVDEMGLTPVDAENGLSALSRVHQAPPDLILLDIDMPVMNGRETLKQLKEDPRTRHIPVIVVSGANETQVALECIELGAEDFLPKPFDSTLLRVRMKSSLEKSRLRAQERAYQRQMETYAVELEERVREKTRDLADAHERLAILDQAKEDFLRLIAHELRTPMTGALAASDLLREQGLDDAGREQALQILGSSVDRLVRIVEDALLLTRIKLSRGEFSLQPRPLGPILAAAIERASSLASSREVRLEPVDAGACSVVCDAPLLGEALASLIECAVKFSIHEQVVHTSVGTAGGSVRLSIQASGRRIPAELIPRFFDVFSLVEPLTPGGDLGLGPPVAAQILRLLGGGVAVESTAEGVVFVVTLRAAEPDPAART